MEKDLQAHWEDIYSRKRIELLGWYEAHPAPSLRLLEQCELAKESRILHVGTGASTLVDELLGKGYKNLIASDLSSEALHKLQSRLGEEESKKVHWMVDDLTNPQLLNLLDPIDLWFDRAVLHFFNEANEQEAYFSLLKQLVKPGGFVIIAAFNLRGAPTCSGLPVHRYNREMLQDRLGKDFELQDTFDHTYVMPSGENRAYIYTLFKRVRS